MNVIISEVNSPINSALLPLAEHAKTQKKFTS